MSRYNSDSFFRAAADSALRAVHECSPLKNLPPEKYDTWHYMELNFDPKDMLLCCKVLPMKITAILAFAYSTIGYFR